MLKKKVIALLIAVLNLGLVIVLITFVIDNLMVQFLLVVYALLFSSIVSFMLRERPGDKND